MFAYGKILPKRINVCRFDDNYIGLRKKFSWKALEYEGIAA